MYFHFFNKNKTLLITTQHGGCYLEGHAAKKHVLQQFLV